MSRQFRLCDSSCIQTHQGGIQGKLPFDFHNRMQVLASKANCLLTSTIACRYCDGVELHNAWGYLVQQLQGQPDSYVQQRWEAACMAILRYLTEVISSNLHTGSWCATACCC